MWASLTVYRLMKAYCKNDRILILHELCLDQFEILVCYSYRQYMIMYQISYKNLKSKSHVRISWLLIVSTVYRLVKAYCKNDRILILHDTLLGSIWNFSMLFISSIYDYVPNFILVARPYQLIIYRINYIEISLNLKCN